MIYDALKRGIAQGDFEEIVLEMKRRGVGISEEIIFDAIASYTG